MKYIIPSFIISVTNFFISGDDGGNGVISTGLTELLILTVLVLLLLKTSGNLIIILFLRPSHPVAFPTDRGKEFERKLEDRERERETGTHAHTHMERERERERGGGGERERERDLKDFYRMRN